MRIEDLDQLIKTVCPIDGINSSGAISFREEATESQRLQAFELMRANLKNIETEGISNVSNRL